MNTVAFRAFSAFAIAFALSSTPCSAALISVYTSAARDGVGSDTKDEFILDSSVGGRSVALQSSFSALGGSANAAASANARSGRFTSFGAKNGAAGDAESGAGAYADFTASGAGSVDFYFDVSGGWDVQDAPGLDARNRFYQEAAMQFVVDGLGVASRQHIIDTAYDADFNPPNLPPTGTTSVRLKYTALVQAGTAYAINAQVYTWISGVAFGTGSLDGVLSYVAHGVALTFDDPEFLVAPVPLPAGGLLLVGGLGFGLVRLRRPVRASKAAA